MSEVTRQTVSYIPSTTKQTELINLSLIGFAVWFSVFAIVIIARSMHWPTVHDAAILLYMSFLTEHGMRLYKDIIEVQFPGAVLLYAFSRHVFGTSDLAFRIFDLSGLILGLTAMLFVVKNSRYWLAAVYGFSIFLLIHTGNFRGVVNLGERDFFVACFLGVGIGGLLEANRKLTAWFMFIFGLAIAFSATIKPTVILFTFAAIPVLYSLRKQRRSLMPYLLWASAGFVAGFGVVLAYVLYQHALGPFLEIEKNLMPVYYRMANNSFHWMARNLFDGRVLILLSYSLALGSLILLVLQPRLRRSIEQQVLFLCAVFGGASYFLQHKGFWYHREPFFFFFYLWIGWVLVASIYEDKRIYRWAALFLLTLTAALYPLLMRNPRWDNRNEVALQRDLLSLDALRSPGEVQCVDETGGCTPTALKMNIVMATGFVTDYLYFLDDQDPRLESMRAQYIQKLKQTRPRLIVLTNEQWPVLDHFGYDKLKYWPAFARLLEEDYSLAIDHPAYPESERGYRIYVRKDAPKL